ncbi:tRNA pseudouridine(55) synthase TruB [Salinisphaera sp. Q1T1-3]|uniref:tRNA pseudouridine(55) synthase TruB n=1 Tax=Salinisphaera sp. Q1T1-3 TaxID=2321229 RepID=UPI000E749F34|nr:tRNA pseudouridine(55) synthase TruB [Salinisphaera sp. Q1T1-3]RJS92710.1 tRNA pseudouridine(55) synthase TruB [Salinisphaera sp. Q1T1-3]
MGRRRKGHAIDGVVLLDKAYGVSSNTALQNVRRRLNAAKAGHTGSLDPLATGLLPVCLGEATKLSSYLLSADKHYRVTAALGAETTTGDLEGEVTIRGEASLPDESELAATVAAFTGPQSQIPPMYSALKVDGKPLYQYAREGVTVARSPRPITVHDLRVVRAAADQVTFDVAVSGGTYVRTLIEDMARHWGGRAHVVALHRTCVGHLGAALPTVSQARIDDDVEAEGPLAAFDWLLPVSTLLADWPAITLTENQAARLGHGQTVRDVDTPAAAAIRLDQPDGRVLGLGQPAGGGGIAPLRLFARPLA